MKKSLTSLSYNKLYYCKTCNKTLLTRINIQKNIKFKNLDIQLNPLDLIIATVSDIEDLHMGIQINRKSDGDSNSLFCRYCKNKLGKIFTVSQQNTNIFILIVNLKFFIVTEFILVDKKMNSSLKIANSRSIIINKYIDTLKQNLSCVYNNNTILLSSERILRGFEKLFNLTKQLELIESLENKNLHRGKFCFTLHSK